MKNKASCKEGELIMICSVWDRIVLTSAGQTFMSVADAESMLRHRSCPLINDPAYGERNQVQSAPAVPGSKVNVG